MSTLKLTGVKKRFQSGSNTVETIKGVDLDIHSGEFVVFVGPSGCGKSTLLRMIAGLESVSEGTISLAGRDVTTLPPADRNVALVFQSYALYPHMTVAENLSFGMRMRGEAKNVIDKKVTMAIEMLRLQPYLHRKPAELSGGQAQRVAIGRALVREPSIFLFDEPLSNLDAELRTSMRVELAALHRELGKTMIYVTHDQVEAMTLAHRIVVLRDGRIEQVGSPLDLYNQPTNQFVAGFIGSPAMNFIPGTANGDGRITLASGSTFTLNERTHVSGDCTLGIRPEHLSITTDTSGSSLAAKVTGVESLGARSLIYAQCEGSQMCIEQTGDIALPAMGSVVRVTAPSAKVYCFGADGKRIASSVD
jgi:ABC-type sugar transport system ATPase subunit